jgi:hypothetical protein
VEREGERDSRLCSELLNENELAGRELAVHKQWQGHWEGRRPGKRGSGLARYGSSIQNEYGVNWSFQQELEP